MKNKLLCSLSTNVLKFSFFFVSVWRVKLGLAHRCPLWRIGEKLWNLQLVLGPAEETWGLLFSSNQEQFYTHSIYMTTNVNVHHRVALETFPEQICRTWETAVFQIREHVIDRQTTVSSVLRCVHSFKITLGALCFLFLQLGVKAASELVWSGVTCRKRLLLPFRRRHNEKASFH